MKFKIPQFIETETKIVGPLTFKQFIWVALGVGLLMISYRVLEGIYFIMTAILIIIVFGALAFYKVQGLPLIEYIIIALSYLFGAKKYLFKKETKEEDNYYG